MRHGLRGITSMASVGVLVATLLVAAAPSGAASNSSSITYTVHPVAVPMAVNTQGAFPTPGTCVAEAGLACYTPQVLHSAYQVPWQINRQWAGTGQQVAIIDAYGSPSIASDLAVFSATFHLPPATLNIIYPGGSPTLNPLKNATQAGWAEETSLDVETVHSLAPGATINLVVAASPAGNVLNNAQNYVVSHQLGDVMSMSYGAPEAAIAGGGNNLQLQQAEASFVAARDANISVFASSGDSGAGNGYAVANALFPASSPLVTATGGTALFVKADTSARSTNYGYAGEWTWNDANASTCPFGCTQGVFGATGGAASNVFPTPDFQAPYQSLGMRTTSDVSFNSSVYTGTMIYLGFLGAPNDGFYFFGGTSEAAPSWAAITADINQARGNQDLGYLNGTLYGLSASTMSSDFHDVTLGDNSFGSPGYSAGPGYDLPTGLGTPVVSNLMSTLASGYKYSASMNQP